MEWRLKKMKRTDVSMFNGRPPDCLGGVPVQQPLDRDKGLQSCAPKLYAPTLFHPPASVSKRQLL